MTVQVVSYSEMCSSVCMGLKRYSFVCPVSVVRVCARNKKEVHVCVGEARVVEVWAWNVKQRYAFF